MSGNTFGTLFSFTSFGESHGPAIGCVVDGCPPGLALAESDIEIATSCEQGVCGTCITRVLEGQCDHRDLYFTEEEKARHDQFTPCCSRALGPLLVLDL